MTSDDLDGHAEVEASPSDAHVAREAQPQQAQPQSEPAQALDQQSDPSGADQQAAQKSLRASTIGVALILCLVATILNLPYQYSEVKVIGDVTSRVDFQFEQSTTPVMAGWPYRYLIDYSADEVNESPLRVFSIQAFAFDLGLAVFVVTVIVFFVYRRNRRVILRRMKKRSISIADLLTLTILLAIPFGYWQRLGVVHRKQTQLVQEVRNEGGHATMSTWVPSLLASRLPDAMLTRLRKVRRIRVEYPSDELAEKAIANQPTTCLRLGGGQYDLQRLEQLANRPHLHDVRISGRVITGHTIQCIASVPRLKTLNLSRTNVSAEAIGALPNKLQRLNLIRSDVVLGDLQTPPWSDSIEVLTVGHPDPGDVATLEIEGWPNLQTLTINELDSQANPVAMKVALTDLPRFSKIELDVFQKFDLTLRRLPELAEIKHLETDWQARLPRGGKVPGTLWCSRFEIEDAPLLEKFTIFGVDLEHFRVQGTPAFKFLGVGAFHRTVSAETYSETLSDGAAKALIEGLGRSDGPTLIDLDAVPLANADFSPLVNNKGIKELLLNNSATNFKQWKTLEGMDELRRLEVKQNEGDPTALKWILKTFPNLEHLSYPTVNFTGQGTYVIDDFALEIVDQPSLKTFDYDDDYGFINSVKLINVPNLEMSLDLSFARNVELTNASSIKRLVLQSPAHIKLSGVGGLQTFAGGGSEINDAVVEELAKCSELKTLTLAYPNATTDAIRQLANLKKLNSLSLPGAEVDDSVLEAWGAQPQLQHLDLRDTEITGPALQRFIKDAHLSSLFVSGAKGLNASDLDFLKDTSISELLVGDIGLEPETFKTLMGKGTLRRVDLSNSRVTAEMLDAIIQNGDMLEHLSLRGCKLAPQKLSLIAARHRRLTFDVSTSDVPTSVMTNLLGSRRVATYHEAKERRMMMGEDINWEPKALINTDYFLEIEQVVVGGPIGAGGQVIIAPSGSATIFSGPSAPIGTQIGRLLGQAFSQAAQATRGSDEPIEIEEPASDQAPDPDDPDEVPSPFVEITGSVDATEVPAKVDESPTPSEQLEESGSSNEEVQP